MEILGIGAPELIFILLIAIIVLGPKDMQKAGKTIGRWLNQLRESEAWKMVRDTSRDLRTLPNKWMREANMEMWEAQQDIRGTIDPRAKPPATPRRPSLSLPDEQESSAQSAPPPADPSPQTSRNSPPIPTDEND
jgi:sec-independent protein translocase protein TatB